MPAVTSYPERNERGKKQLVIRLFNYLCFNNSTFSDGNFVSLWNVLIGNHGTYKLVRKFLSKLEKISKNSNQ